MNLTLTLHTQPVKKSRPIFAQPRTIIIVGSMAMSAVCGLSEAQAASGTEAASFLEIPVGAGPAAMGGAYSALASNAYAPIYNPAGLGFAPSTQLAGQHLSYLESIHYEFMSFIQPLGMGKTLGGSLQYLGSGDINQTNDSGNTTGTF